MRIAAKYAAVPQTIIFVGNICCRLSTGARQCGTLISPRNLRKDVVSLSHLEIGALKGIKVLVRARARSTLHVHQNGCAVPSGMLRLFCYCCSCVLVDRLVACTFCLLPCLCRYHFLTMWEIPQDIRSDVSFTCGKSFYVSLACA